MGYRLSFIIRSYIRVIYPIVRMDIGPQSFVFFFRLILIYRSLEIYDYELRGFK